MAVLGVFLILFTGLVVVAFGPLAILLLWPVFIPFLLIMFLLIAGCFSRS